MSDIRKHMQLIEGAAFAPVAKTVQKPAKTERKRVTEAAKKQVVQIMKEAGLPRDAATVGALLKAYTAGYTSRR